ncbi:hypothetical protein CVT24_006510 [Panaeolus cyanescens]|uniref:Protein kinase domain-containing protein n=1 Tax=Panaeolus cyanescens TaxID=181874 RepID=A0A409VZQ0_9AGAR|nr:hypothetical protein CVT24_006510 [Panaeolus cyanescens]
MKRGYKLHDKFDPDWVPPWELDPTLHPFECIESTRAKRRFCDGIRIADNSRVMIKLVKTAKTELPIMQYLSTPELRKDPRNHTVPLIDAIPVPADDDTVMLVMPLLLEFDDLPFRRVGEVVECLEQFFEMDRDACSGNLMMDVNPLITTDWHPWKWRTQDGYNKKIQWVDRWITRPNRYYLIDFDLSRRFVDRRLALFSGNWGQDRTVPEMSPTAYCDGLKVDVYQMGNSINRLIRYYPDLQNVMQPLANALTVKDPTQRPSARQAVRLLKKFIEVVPQHEMKRRIWRHGYYTLTQKERFLVQYCGKQSFF